MVRRKRRTVKKKVKWGRIGAPGSAKRRRHMARIRRMRK